MAQWQGLLCPWAGNSACLCAVGLALDRPSTPNDWNIPTPSPRVPHPLCLPGPQVFLPGPAVPLNLPTVLITVQQKKSELRKDQSADVLSHWGFTLESSFLRSSCLSSITQKEMTRVSERVLPFKTGPTQGPAGPLPCGPLNTKTCLPEPCFSGSVR